MVVYSISDMEEGLFFMHKNSGYERCLDRIEAKTAANVSDDRKRKYTVEVEVVRVKITLAKTAANVSDDRKRKYTVEVEVVRVKITLACTECKQRNYNMTKEKKNHPDRMETKKYCKFCKRHTMHKETK